MRSDDKGYPKFNICGGASLIVNGTSGNVLIENENNRAIFSFGSTSTKVDKGDLLSISPGPGDFQGIA